MVYNKALPIKKRNILCKSVMHFEDQENLPNLLKERKYMWLPKVKDYRLA